LVTIFLNAPFGGVIETARFVHVWRLSAVYIHPPRCKSCGKLIIAGWILVNAFDCAHITIMMFYKSWVLWKYTIYHMYLLRISYNF